jgi:hypothetical protein
MNFAAMTLTEIDAVMIKYRVTPNARWLPGAPGTQYGAELERHVPVGIGAHLTQRVYSDRADTLLQALVRALEKAQAQGWFGEVPDRIGACVIRFDNSKQEVRHG